MTEIVRFAHRQFPAEVVSSASFGPFTLTETAYAPDATLRRHSHERASIVYVLRGTFSEQYRNRVRAGRPGLAILRPEEEPHADRFDHQGGRCLNVEIDGSWLVAGSEREPLLQSSSDIGGEPAATIGRRLQQELMLRDTASPLAVESLVLATLVDVTRRHSRSHPPRWLMAARDLLHARFAEPLTLALIAEAVGVHPVSLATAFRRHFGCTVGGYIRQLRIECARRQLVESDAALCEIANAAGFCDQSHFARVFRGAICLTPSEYRRRFSTNRVQDD